MAIDEVEFPEMTSDDCLDVAPHNQKTLFIDCSANYINKNAVRNLLEKFGEIVALRIPEGKEFYFAEFAVAKDAESALRNLQTHKPLGIRAEFARDRGIARGREPRGLQNLDPLPSFHDQQLPPVPYYKFPFSKKSFQADTSLRMPRRFAQTLQLNEEIKPADDDKCFHCGRLCEGKCDKCNTKFCGVKCMKKAVEEHSSFCTPRTGVSGEVVNSQKSVRKEVAAGVTVHAQADSSNESQDYGNSDCASDERTPRFPNESIVIIEYAANNRDVYISSPSEAAAKYNKLYNEVARECIDGAPLPNLPPEGSVVAAELNGCFYRARIISRIADDEAVLLFIDFGYTLSINLSNLRGLSDELCRRAPAAIKVGLIDVPLPDFVSPRQVLAKFIENRTEFILKYTDDPPEVVELHFKDGSNTANACINFAIDKLPVAEFQAPLVKRLHCVNWKGLDVGHVKLIVLYAAPDVCETGIIFCGMMHDDLRFIVNELPEKLAQYYQGKTKPYKPRPLEICAVTDSTGAAFHRALCIREVDACSVELTFFDYGTRDIVDTRYIRPLPDEIVSRPAIAYECIIVGLAEETGPKKVLTEKEKSKILKILEGEVTASVKALEDARYQIDIDEISALLTE